MRNALIWPWVIAALLLILSVIPACADGQSFKEDYESLNGQPVPGHTEYVYQTLLIEDRPQAIQVSAQEAALLDNEYAIVYMGANWCPWCRNALPSLIKATISEGFSCFYYVDLTEERDQFEVIGGSLVKIRESTLGYQTLLNRLDEFLTDYSVTNSEGMVYETGEKRIYLPTLAFIRNGEFISVMQPLCDPEEGKTPYDPLTESQQAWLTKSILLWLQKSAQN